VASQESRNAKGPAIGIVLNTVRAARNAHADIRKHLRAGSFDPDEVLVLTGSMRGIDRDDVVSKESTTRESRIFRRFRAGHERLSDTPAFLIATSCIEVGADIDLDHLGTEVCPLDSLVQRLGRVNRRGDRPTGFPSVARVISPDEGSVDIPGRVAQWLRELLKAAKAPDASRGLDGSPDGVPSAAAVALDTSSELRAQLCGPPEPVPALTRAVVDDLSMTALSLDEADRPDVGLWLHGCAADDSTGYVELGWRLELNQVIREQDAASLLDAFPLAPRETARCLAGDAVGLLRQLRMRQEYDGRRCVVIARDGVTRAYRIEMLPDDDSELFRLIAWSQIALPCLAGGYEHHFVDPESAAVVSDVADRAIPETWVPRRRLWLRDGFLGTAPERSGCDVEVSDSWIAEDADELLAVCQPAVNVLLGPEWDAVASAGSAESGIIVARCRRRKRVFETADRDDASIGYRKPVPLRTHLDGVVSWAERLCDRLQID
jgi:CRISPR-associated helicase Cas3